MKKEYIIITILIVIILIFCLLIITTLNNQSNSNGKSYRETIANNSDELGSVEVIKNIGNPNSKKIAYVVGMHPLEHLTHEILVEILPNMSNLNYCYDIYVINITEDVGYYGDGLDNYENPGRQNGQNLAYKYVYPEIVNDDYELAVDVHSNIGAYDFKTFVFCPLKECMGAEYADNVSQNCENITYYASQSITSGPYLTIPLNENGIPAFYFEEYSFAPQYEKDRHMLKLINAVDNLNLN